MKLLAVMIMTVSLSAMAAMPEPLVLGDGEEIIFDGGAGDVLECANKRYDAQVFNIKVTKNDKMCDEDGNVLKKIYIDGVLTDVCSENIKTTLRSLDGLFTDFEDLLELPDEEFKKFINATPVGSCAYNPPTSVRSTNYSGSARMEESFRTYRAETQIEMRQSTPNEATTIKAFRDFIKDGLCGNYSASRLEANKEKSLKMFGSADVGFDFFVGKGKTDDELVSMGYPVKRLREKGVSIDKLVAAGRSPRDLVDGGFTVPQLIGKFSLRKLVEANLLRELKASGYKADELKSNGAGLQALEQAGFSLVRDLKPIFSLAEFMAVKDWNNNRVYSNRQLRETLGYSATEMKGQGLGIQDLQGAGYNLVNDIRPLFTLKNFMDQKDWNNNRIFSNTVLRTTLGFTAPELKAQGVGIQDLQSAGYNIKTEIQPLFSLTEFMAVKDWNNNRVYSNTFLRQTLNYTARDLKDKGVGIQDLQSAGYDMKNEIKPLFTLQNFIDLKDWNNNRLYPNSFLRQTLGYSASELRDRNIGIQDLQSAGYDMRSEIKPLFSVQNFIAVKDWNNNRVYSNSALRSTLQFSATEMRNAGLGLQELFSAGYSKPQLIEAGFNATAVNAL